MFGKILITVLLLAITPPVVGTVLAWTMGMKGERFVVPGIFIGWAVIILFMWII